MRFVPVLLLLALTLNADPSDYFGDFLAAAPSAASLKAAPDWYKDEVFYHIWLYAFADSDGNGVGDLKGVESQLDYLKDLGVTSLWLSPFWKSPSSHGYDVTDFSVVDPRYGTNDDLRRLLASAHSRGMRVIFDFVPNHVSAQHPWFIDSRADRNNKRNWFLWRDQAPKTGWLGFNGSPAWHSLGKASYYALFWDQMPDLNYREPAVRQAMASVVAQWLNFGFDGLRVDAVKYLVENETSGANVDQPETLEFFRRLREVLDAYTPLGYSKFMVAENWTADADSLESYITNGRQPGFHATLDFPFGNAVANILNGTGTVEGDLGREYDSLVRRLEKEGGWTFTFLSNHDNYQSRPATLFGSPAKVRVAQTLQMTAWGTPVLYYGNELGMPGVNGSDGNMRRPFPWKEVSEARAHPDSVWNWQALLDQLRRDHSALRRGDMKFLTADRDVAAVYLRTLGDDQVLVVLNLTEEPLDEFTVDLKGTLAAKGVSALVGPPVKAGTTLSVEGLGAYGVRLYQLGKSLPALRGDFAPEQE